MDRYCRCDHFGSRVVFRMGRKSVRNRGMFFLKLKLRQFSDVYEVMFSEYKTEIHVHRHRKLPAMVLRR